MKRNLTRNSRGQRCHESRPHPRRQISFFSAAAAARLGLGSVRKLGLGSSARPWLLFKRVATCRARQTRRNRAAGSISWWSPVRARGRGRFRPVGPTCLRLRSTGPAWQWKKRGGRWRSAAGLVRQWAGRVPGPCGGEKKGRKGAGRGEKNNWAFGPRPERESLSLFLFLFSFKNKPIPKHFQNQI